MRYLTIIVLLAVLVAVGCASLAQTQKGVRWLINAVRPRKLPLTSPNNRGSRTTGAAATTAPVTTSGRCRPDRLLRNAT